MATILTLELTAREETKIGTSASRRLRRAGRTPGVIYGNDGETAKITVSADELRALIDRGARVLDVTLDGDTQKAMFRELQWDTFGTQIYHFDLLRIDADQRIEVTVPIELRGTPPGTTSGGQLEQPLHSVTIECLAVEVPEKLTLRVNHLEIGDSVTVADFELEGDARVLLEPETVVARVVEVLEIEDEEVVDEIEVGAGEPEVIGREDEDAEADADDGGSEEN